MRTTARLTRENRTIAVDFQNEATYVQLLGAVCGDWAISPMASIAWSAPSATAVW